METLDAVLPGDLDRFGIESRDPDGLTGVAASPFLHADFAHLMANTVPFLVLGSIVALRNPQRFWLITATITVVGGLGVWLLGPANAITIGASGVVFGFLTYLIAAGVLTRHWLDVVIALGVLFVYGGILIGALPFGVTGGVSWLAHLTGALAGVLAAFLFARQSRSVVHVPQ
jgi:membrane associated rhomboid family serine protease